ncbi:MAG: chloride channel protein [Fibrobacterales bacterium]
MKQPFDVSKAIKKARIISNTGPLLLFSAGVGVITGLAAVVFHFILDQSVEHILGTFAGVAPWGSDVTALIPRYLFFIIPTLGGLLSGILVYKLAPETAGHGTDAMIDNFHNKGGRVRKRVPFVKAITSIITIASGGSAGIEGPTAQIGSGIGSLFSRLFTVTTKMRRLIMLSGTAAGLGAIFKAPLGGALTSVEILYKEDFESDGFLSSIIASVVAYTTYASIVGYGAVFGDLMEFTFTGPKELVFYCLLGVLCAPFSWVYIKTFYAIRDFFAKLPIPNMFKPAVGGLAVGIIFYIRPEVISGGWDYLIDAMQGDLAVGSSTTMLVLTLLAISVVKILATSFTVASGGSGGVFGPSLFIGGMFGGALGYTCHALFPEIVTQPGAFVIVGMGAFFAGAANAPVATVVMVCELTGNYNLLAPLMIASAIHIYFAHKWSIYENQVHNKFSSRAHRNDMNIDVLKNLMVKDVIDPSRPIVRVNRMDSLKKLERVMANTDEDLFLVVNNDDTIIGLVDTHTIRKVIFEESASELVIVDDMMDKVQLLYEHMDLHTTLQAFLRHGIGELPVVDSEGKIISTIKQKDIINAYNDILKKL